MLPLRFEVSMALILGILVFLNLPTIEDEGITFLRNVGVS
jgi:hypothetical protein